MKNLYIVSLAILLQACAVGGSYKPTAPSSDVARQSCPTTEGVILDMLNVSIEQDRSTAQSIGAGVGGYIGNEATDDKDDVTQVVATLAGAMIGNAIGDAVSKSGDKIGVELIVFTLKDSLDTSAFSFLLPKNQISCSAPNLFTKVTLYGVFLHSSM